MNSLEAFKIMVNDNNLDLSYHNTILTIEKDLKVLEIIKECFDFNGFEEFIPNEKWFESEEKQDLLKEVFDK